MRALILGGTADANLLADNVSRAGLDAIYSYGGRTRAPSNQPLPTRIGGFGGASGLADYIRREGITHVVFGQSARSRWDLAMRGSIVDRFLRDVRNATVQVVPVDAPGADAAAGDNDEGEE